MSSSKSPRELFDIASKKQRPQIEHLYDEDYYTSLEPQDNFVNQGDTAFAAHRANWVKNISSENAAPRTTYTQDIDAIATSLVQFKTFSQPVPLDLMAEILESAWIEGTTL